MTNSTNSEDEAMPMKIRESDDTDFELMRSPLIWKIHANITGIDSESAEENEGQSPWEKARTERAKHRRQMLEKIRASLRGETSEAIEPDEKDESSSQR